MGRATLAFAMGVTTLAAAASGAAGADQGFEISAGPLIMTREQASAPILSRFTSSPTAGDIFDARNFNFSWNGGVEGRIGYRFQGPFGLETGGFWLAPWHQTIINNTFSGEAQLPTTMPTLYGVPSGTVLNLSYQSRLFGADAAATYTPGMMPAVTLLGGVAGYSLQETLDFKGVFAGGSFLETDTWQSRNLLIGPEIGARADLLRLCGTTDTPWEVVTGLKVALLWNGIDNKFNDNITSLNQRATGSNSGSTFAEGLQGGISVGYHFAPNVAVTVGYQALYLNGVALAPDQVRATSNFNVPGPNTLGRRTSDVLFHGLTAALKVSFN